MTVILGLVGIIYGLLRSEDKRLARNIHSLRNLVQAIVMALADAAAPHQNPISAPIAALTPLDGMGSTMSEASTAASPSAAVQRDELDVLSASTTLSRRSP